MKPQRNMTNCFRILEKHVSRLLHFFSILDYILYICLLLFQLKKHLINLIIPYFCQWHIIYCQLSRCNTAKVGGLVVCVGPTKVKACKSFIFNSFLNSNLSYKNNNLFLFFSFLNLALMSQKFLNCTNYTLEPKIYSRTKNSPGTSNINLFSVLHHFEC